MMTRVLKKKKTARRQINIHNEWEIAYWSQRFGCTTSQLIDAVKKAGPSPVKVVRELEK